MTGVQIRFGLQFKTEINPDNGRSIMQVDIIDFYMDLNRKNLDFDFDWDGLSGSVISAIEPVIMLIFKGTICDEIEDAVEDVVYMLNPMVN
jgi:hypothetical protein